MSTTSPPRRTRAESAKAPHDESSRDRKAAPSTEGASATSGEAVAAGISTPTSGHSALSADIVREIYLTRPDGLSSFYDGSAPKDDAKSRVAALLGAVAELESTDPENEASIRKLLKRALRRDGKPTTEKHGLPKPAAAYHSEGDRLSILRTDWSDEGVQVAVDWAQPEMRIEMFVGSRAVFDGRMAPRVRVAGAACDPIGTWEEVCWESNVDVDYLELEIAMAGDVRLQRQIILTRRDGALFVADAVLAPTSTKLACETALPLVAGCEFKPAAETREATAVIGKQRLLFLPLALGEWRTESCSGDLIFEAGRVVLRQQAAQADALYVPLAVIYDRKRAKRECTWRRLTVGENLRLVPPSEACGYRWQLGEEHWLAYRSLTEQRANRTVLGINLQTNFLLSRFTTAGESEPLIEIDD
jgi:hypothetical protein